MSWSQGYRAESYVAGRLHANHWKIEARNYRRRGLEIDIIASRGDRLICVEVKARSRRKDQENDWVHPGSLLGPKKTSKLRTGMLLWLSDKAPEETRNAEFWLCLVSLPLSWSEVEWIKLGDNDKTFSDTQ